MANVLQALRVMLNGGNNQATVGPMDGAGAERRQRATSLQSGAARAAVLGINDGLVTNISLILGMVGATATPQVVQLAGLASLVAGAASMAVGEYISMRAQVELLERLLEEEREAIRTDPQRERTILQATMEQHGFNQATAAATTKDLFRDPEQALTVYARAVLGVNPQEMGSAWASAISSFVTFACGAFVPLVPWFVTTGTSAMASSLGLTGGGRNSDWGTAREVYQGPVPALRHAAAPRRRPGLWLYLPGRQILRHCTLLSGRIDILTLRHNRGYAVELSQ